jgi:hypothetical protein
MRIAEIVCTVVATMKHNLLWMLWFAWLCFLFNVWSIGRRYHRRRWWIWISGALLVSAGLFGVRNWLSTSPNSLSPVANTPTAQGKTEAVVSPVPMGQQRTIESAPKKLISKPRSAPFKPATSASTLFIWQAGSGNWQTVAQGPVTQSNSGGCNRQVVGDTDNTTYGYCNEPPGITASPQIKTHR